MGAGLGGRGLGPTRTKLLEAKCDPQGQWRREPGRARGSTTHGPPYRPTPPPAHEKLLNQRAPGGLGPP